MVVARLFGGLGNQLFIYAAAKQLALANKTELVIDDQSGFKKDFYRRVPELKLFNSKYREATPAEAFEFPLGNYMRGAFRTGRHIINSGFCRYIFEYDSSRYLPEITDTRANHIFLEGYWQCDKYFQSIIPEIRTDFQMVCEHDQENIEFSHRINAEPEPVCIHARRLHGVPNQKNAQPDPKIKSLSLSYYESGIQKILLQHPNAHFFCFSDFPEWFEENLRKDLPITFVTHNKYGENRSHEDFWLMTHCKHYIISNSTFSWWGAWLSKLYNKKRVVISPPKRFWDNKDIVPENWSVCNE